MRAIILWVTLHSILVFANIPTCFSSSMTVGPKYANILVENTESKIINGSDAEMHSIPYQVSLQYYNPVTRNHYHFCGGSILDRRTILTAAHCVRGFEILLTRVAVGDHDLAVIEGGEQYVKYYAVLDATVHPMYNSSVIDYDYAVIRLRTPLNFTRAVQPVVLPQVGTLYDVTNGANCWSSGWGNTHGDGTNRWPKILQEVQTPIRSQQGCTESYHALEFDMTPRMICAGGPPDSNPEGYQGICQGDSGGPLICKDDVGGVTLVGLSSFSTNPCGQDLPAGYASVVHQLTWIRSQMEK